MAQNTIEYFGGSWYIQSPVQSNSKIGGTLWNIGQATVRAITNVTQLNIFSFFFQNYNDEVNILLQKQLHTYATQTYTNIVPNDKIKFFLEMRMTS